MGDSPWSLALNEQSELSAPPRAKRAYTKILHCCHEVSQGQATDIIFFVSLLLVVSVNEAQSSLMGKGDLVRLAHGVF